MVHVLATPLYLLVSVRDVVTRAVSRSKERTISVGDVAILGLVLQLKHRKMSEIQFKRIDDARLIQEKKS